MPCLCAALISAVATLSNIIILKETLPRVVEAQEAAKEAKLQDEEKPLLESNGKESGPEPAIDIEGACSLYNLMTFPQIPMPRSPKVSEHTLADSPYKGTWLNKPHTLYRFTRASALWSS